MDRIDENHVREYFSYLRNRVATGEIKSSYAGKLLARFKTFIRYAYTQRYLETLPRNMNLSIAPENNAVKVFADEEVLSILGTLKEEDEQLYLCSLLALNCGMNPADISGLLDTEVDWEKGTISRKRTKTKKHQNVPLVEYPLWTETFTLLKKHRTRGDRAIGISTSSIRAAWLRWRKAKPRVFEKPFKTLRATSASKLNETTEYARMAQLFLGHAAHTIAERHYLTVPEVEFAAALEWLGQQWRVQ